MAKKDKYNWTEEELKKLPLHKTAWLSSMGPYLIRVVGGWIYVLDEGSAHPPANQRITSTFVPERD